MLRLLTLWAIVLLAIGVTCASTPVVAVAKGERVSENGPDVEPRGDGR